jgi:zinc transport system ATP-binding protein
VQASHEAPSNLSVRGHDTATSDRDVLVDARNISVRFGDRQVLDHVDLQIHRGEVVTLVGLNGSGKTTLVRILLGLSTPDSGSVKRAPSLRIGYSPQRVHRDAILPLTVERFLALGTRVSRARLRALLQELGANALFNSQIADLSGGEFHRVMLARAMVQAPDLLVLDEPLAGVDVASQAELYRLIAMLRDRYGCGVLLVSHDLHVVMAATDKVVCLNHHVCCTGHPRSVAADPQFIALFGPHVAETLAVYTHDHDHRHDISGEPVPLEDADSAHANVGDRSEQI